MANDKALTPSSDSEIAAFLDRAAKLPAKTDRGRLIFALDATASRQPTWDQACQIQGEMFITTQEQGLGGLSIQLVWYRGFNDFAAGPWHDGAAGLLAEMNRVHCAGGMTQIERVLRHAVQQTRKLRINAVVFIGDCMEEDPGKLSDLAGQLGLLGVPVFVFHEGGEARAARTFREIARLSHGAYCGFDTGSAQQLRELLGAVAIYAVGGKTALQDFSRGHQRGLAGRLAHQIDHG